MIQECIKTSEDGGPYSRALKIGDVNYISAQVPDRIIGESTYSQTLQCFEKIEAVLAACDISLKYIMKTTAFLADLKDLPEVDKAYTEKLSEPYPARSTVSVKELPAGAKVVIEAFAMDTRALEVLCAKENGCCTEKECSFDG